MEKVSTLPSFKNVDVANLKLNPVEWRKGEKPTFNIMSLLILVGLGYVTWTFVLPLLFGIIKVAVIGGALILAYLSRKIIWSMMKKIVRKFHEAAIRYDVWGTFEEQKVNLKEKENEAIRAESVILTTEKNMQAEALKQEKLAKSYQERLTEIAAEKDLLLNEREKYTTEDSKQDERYVELCIQINDIAAESERIISVYNQSNDLVEKFGARANIFKKFRMKFKYFLSAIKNEVKNFDTTVQMLRVDYDAATAMDSGTSAVKEAMLFEDEWEVKYATEFVRDYTALRIANTSSNLTDINDIMTSINMNTDPSKAFAKLEKLTKSISDGTETVNSAKKYNNPELILNTEEKKASGFDGIL